MSIAKQLNREAKWAAYLTLFYLLGWVLCAYFSPTGRGLLSFPIWFELSCLYLPLLFILLAMLVIKGVYQSVDLEGENNED